MQRVIVPVKYTVYTDSVDAAYEVANQDIGHQLGLIIQDMKAEVVVTVEVEVEVDIEGDKTEQEAIDMACEVVGTHNGLAIDGPAWMGTYRAG